MKVIKSLENTEILLKGTTRKITFFRPLMTAGLPLMKSVHTPLAKNVLLPFGISAGMSAADAAIQKKKKSWIRSSFGLNFAYNRINNFK